MSKFSIIEPALLIQLMFSYRVFAVVNCNLFIFFPPTLHEASKASYLGRGAAYSKRRLAICIRPRGVNPTCTCTSSTNTTTIITATAPLNGRLNTSFQGTKTPGWFGGRLIPWSRPATLLHFPIRVFQMFHGVPIFSVSHVENA